MIRVSVCVALDERKEVRKPGPAEWGLINNRIHTEASGLDVSLLSCGGVGIGVSKDRVLADREVLVKAPLS